MKASEQYFPVVLFIMLYKVVLTFESVGEILKCDHSNDSFKAALSHDVVRFKLVIQLTFEPVHGTVVHCWSLTIQMEPIELSFSQGESRGSVFMHICQVFRIGNFKTFFSKLVLWNL